MLQPYQPNSEKFFRNRAEIFGSFYETTFLFSVLKFEDTDKIIGRSRARFGSKTRDCACDGEGESTPVGNASWLSSRAETPVLTAIRYT